MVLDIVLEADESVASLALGVSALAAAAHGAPSPVFSLGQFDAGHQWSGH